MSFLSMRDISDAVLTTECCMGLVCDFLLLTYNTQYRTITTYRSALRHPILFFCGMNIRSLSSNLFLWSAFNFQPPLRAKSMPNLSLNGLLSFSQMCHLRGSGNSLISPPVSEAPLPYPLGLRQTHRRGGQYILYL